MRIKQLTLSIVMLAVISPNLSFGRSLGQSGEKLVKVEKLWGGEIKLKLRQQAPPNGLVVDEKAWAKLWMAYRGNEELPKIDFDKQMILVRVGKDPNNIGIDPNSLILDEGGELKVILGQTDVLYINPKTCKYIFLLISREGVKSINGSLFVSLREPGLTSRSISQSRLPKGHRCLAASALIFSSPLGKAS